MSLLKDEDDQLSIPIAPASDGKPHSITCGEMGEDDMPKKLDHWNISAYPELVAIYGDKPQRIIVQLPTDRMEEFITERYVKWGTSKAGRNSKVRMCEQHGDERICTHRIAEEVLGNKYIAGDRTGCICEALKLFEDDKYKNIRCRYDFYLRAFITNPITGKIDNMYCYLFENHAPNSGRAVKAAIRQIAAFMQMQFKLQEPPVAYIPFELAIKMAENREDAKKTYPIWHMRCVYSGAGQLARRVLQIADRFGRKQLAEAMKALPMSEEESFEESVKQIETPAIEIPNLRQQELPLDNDPLVAKSTRQKEGMLAAIKAGGNKDLIRQNVKKLLEQGDMLAQDAEEVRKALGG